VFTFERLNHSITGVYENSCWPDPVDTCIAVDKLKKLKNSLNFERFEGSRRFRASTRSVTRLVGREASQEGKKAGMIGPPMQTGPRSIGSPCEFDVERRLAARVQSRLLAFFSWASRTAHAGPISIEPPDFSALFESIRFAVPVLGRRLRDLRGRRGSVPVPPSLKRSPLHPFLRFDDAFPRQFASRSDGSNCSAPSGRATDMTEHPEERRDGPFRKCGTAFAILDG